MEWRRKLGFGAVGGLVGLSALTFAAWALRPPPAPPAPNLAGVLVAHRAGLSEAPENSLQAIRAAAAAGAGAVELDVRVGPQGPVCAHDAEQVPGAPLLADALATARQAGVLVELDVKTGALGGRRLVRQVVEVVHDAGMSDRVWVSAFHPATLWWVRRTEPALPVGVPLSRFRWTGFARWIRASVLEPRVDLVTPERLHAWHAAGWTVEVWTVHDPEAVAALRAAGAAVVVDAVRPHPTGSGEQG